jgi:hypothetical protein
MADVWHTVFGVAGEWSDTSAVPLRPCALRHWAMFRAIGSRDGAAVADRRDEVEVPDGTGQE